MKNSSLLLICVFVFSFGTDSIITAQNADFKKLPKETAEKLKKKFSKSAFIKSIEEQREEYKEMVLKLKRHTDEKGNHPFENDDELVKAYDNTKIAYNKVLDLMISDINAAKNIFQYHLFDANTRYEDQLAEAKETGDTFMKLADYKLSGETKFLGKIIRWIIKIWPILKRIEEIYLDHVKAIMTERLENAKFLDWSEIK